MNEKSPTKTPPNEIELLKQLMAEFKQQQQQDIEELAKRVAKLEEKVLNLKG